MQKVIIIGAGPAGLSVARMLIESGYEVEIFEADSKVGGLSKSFSLFGQIVDVGPHRFFSKDKRLNDFWLAHTGGTHKQVRRLTRIFYNKKFFYYPLRGFDALFKLGFIESSLCVLSYLKAKIFPFKGDSFESWVANAFGYRLYSIFFKSYTQKLWGIPCDRLDSDFAAQRIKGLNLYEAIKSAFFGDKNKKHKTLVDEFSYPDLGAGVVYENMAAEIVKKGGKIHLGAKVMGITTEGKCAKGVVIQRNSDLGNQCEGFAKFPEARTQSSLTSENLTKTTHSNTATTRIFDTNSNATGVSESSGSESKDFAESATATDSETPTTGNSKILGEKLGFSSGQQGSYLVGSARSYPREKHDLSPKAELPESVIEADIIISTAPFSDMVLSLKELDSDIVDLAKDLKFRNTILVYIEVDSKDIFADNWIYVHSTNTATGRITNFRNWTSGLLCGQESSILCLEYWANDEEELWKLDDEALIEIAKKDLVESSLVIETQILRGFVYKIHRSYPIYTQGYKEGLHRIYEALDSFKNLYFIGRNGSFKYNNQDHSILMGLMCADKILGRSEADLWCINTDYEYQEGRTNTQG